MRANRTETSIQLCITIHHSHSHAHTHTPKQSNRNGEKQFGVVHSRCACIAAGARRSTPTSEWVRIVRLNTIPHKTTQHNTLCNVHRRRKATEFIFHSSVYAFINIFHLKFVSFFLFFLHFFSYLHYSSRCTVHVRCSTHTQTNTLTMLPFILRIQMRRTFTNGLTSMPCVSVPQCGSVARSKQIQRRRHWHTIINNTRWTENIINEKRWKRIQ